MIGYVGNGVQSSSSSSNLSPLAPPFTVDRSNSKQNPQYPTTTSSMNNWHHNSSSSRLDLFPNSDLGLDSVRTTPLASSTDFSYNSTTNSTWSHKNPNPNPSSATFGNPGPYYTPYDPPLPYVSSLTGVDDNAPPIQPSYDFLTSRSLSGIPEWGGLWNGPSTDGKLMATDSINRGSGTSSEVDSMFTQGNYADGFGRENQLQDKTFVGKNRKPIAVEISSNFAAKNDHLSSSRARSGFNVSDINVMDGFLLKVDNSDVAAVNSSDSLDSPCWKGAPASMSASFEVADQQQQKHLVTKKLEASSSSSSHNLNSREGGIHIFPPYGDPLKSQPVFGASFQNEATFQYGKQDSNIGCSIAPEISKSPIREQCNKSTDRAPKRNSNSTKPIQSIDKNVKAKDSEKQQGVKVDLLSSQRINLISDAVITHEKVTAREASPDMDVHMLVNAMQNLSELLLSKCSHDGCALDKVDAEALKQITNNLSACNKKKNKIVVQTPPTKHQPRTLAQFSSRQHDMVGGSADQFIADEGGMKRDDVVCGKTIQKNYAQLFTALRDDDGAVISKDYHVIQDIKKVLDKDFESEEELESDSGLFKNLWLEAEAELCLSNYRTRFERFRKTRETERSNNNLGLGSAKDSELQKDMDVPEKSLNLDGLEAGQVLDRPQEPASDGHVLPQVNSNGDDVESSVMARFHILKSRTINQEGKIPDDPAVASEMTQREDNNNKNFQVAVGPSYLKDDELGYNGYYGGYVNEKELKVHGSSPNYEPSSPSYEPISYDIWKNSVSAKIASGAAEWYNPSLDWEHVLKDDFVSTFSSQSSLQPI